MTLYAENDSSQDLGIDFQAIAEEVALAVLDSEGCPFEVTLNLLLTDNRGIREYNRDYRGIDRETDVLSTAFVETRPFFRNLQPPTDSVRRPSPTGSNW